MIKIEKIFRSNISGSKGYIIFTPESRRISGYICTRLNFNSLEEKQAIINAINTPSELEKFYLKYNQDINDSHDIRR